MLELHYSHATKHLGELNSISQSFTELLGKPEPKQVWTTPHLKAPNPWF